MLNLKTIPDELKALRQWICYSNDKTPKNPKTGGNAQANNPQTWGTFEQAIDAVNRYGFEGIGFKFAEPYFGVDLDHCIDNREFINEFVETLQSYAEISRSGTGIHIICRGKLPDGARRRGNVEMYDCGRYFIMTGNCYNEKYTNIIDCTEKIKILHSKYLGNKRANYTAQYEITPISMSDAEIIDLAKNCKSGKLFDLLFNGNWEGIYSSQSEADLALCNQLAFWTQKNERQIDNIFRASGLMRAKWDEKRGAFTYGELTISKAVANCENVYNPKDAGTSLAFGLFHSTEQQQQPIQQHEYDMTDTGNAHRMRDKYINQVRFSYVRGKWLYWTGKNWEVDEMGEIKKMADIIVDDLKREAMQCFDPDEQKQKIKFAVKTANSTGKHNMILEAQHLDGIPVGVDELDNLKDCLNCQNGIINLRNGELISHNSSYMMTRITHAEYDLEGEKRPERWLKFLDEVTNGDRELQHYLQKCVGYSLTGSTREQCVFFLYGVGNNGKSTFVDVITEMLGSYAANVQPETIMMRNQNNNINSDIARLQSVRMVTSEEPSEGVRLNEGLVKQLTGGGKVTCRFLYHDEFEYVPEFKIWVTTNHKPIIRGTDFGIWRRIRLIPFEVNIPKENIDKNLKYKLREEMPQIMRWAVEGALMWQREGLEPPEVVVKATNEYKTEMDVLGMFVEECTEVAYGEYVLANDLYNAYENWIEENKELYKMSKRKFFLEMTKKIPDKTRFSSGFAYNNIRLVNINNKIWEGLHG